ncbi:MAG: ABC transporter permease [Actinomycetota bacterium]
MTVLATTVRQFRYENRAFWRNPAAAFFTFIFPLFFLFLFPLIFGEAEVTVGGYTVDGATFYVPAIGVFAIVTASYTNTAMSLVFARDEGVLKRKRGTPLEPSAYMGGRVLQAMFMALVMTAITVVVGVFVHGVEVPDNTLLAFVVTVALGAASFCALGIAITGLVPNVDAGAPIINATVLPLMFLSDVFLPADNLPDWLRSVSEIFPIYHFSQAMLTSFNPFETGSGFEWDHLGIVCAWGVAGVLVALKTFTWEPRR